MQRAKRKRVKKKDPKYQSRVPRKRETAVGRNLDEGHKKRKRRPVRAA